MPRNTAFRSEREPFRHTKNLQLDHSRVHGPFAFLNPTQAHFHAAESSTEDADSPASDDVATESTKERAASDWGFKWSSRNNRKGRHALVYTPAGKDAAAFQVPPPTNSFDQVMKGIWRMFTYFPVWDVSYLVATVFTWGSVLWVINAFFSYLPYTNPSTEFSGEVLYGGGITAFIGATVFEVGSILLMLEAVNENRVGCFGWALEQAYDDAVEHGSQRTKRTRVIPSLDECVHHHQNKANFVGQPREKLRTMLSEKGIYADPTPDGSRSWVWFPSMKELRTHYLRDLGFLACSSQMIGATVFWVSGFTALPGIFTALDTTEKLNGAYWIPQIVGGCGFVISGTLFMIETQKHWWQPAPSCLGWWVGLFNNLGGFGFSLCPIFGLYASQHWAAYQASCSTFWGSWAFLIGSVIQWYESLDKHLVEKAEDA